MDATIYKILLWALPILLAILGFIGALAVKSLINLATDMNEIKVIIKGLATQHEDLEGRIERLEDKIFS